jgi:hypothetical protein
VLLDGTEACSARRSACTLFTSALAAGVLPEVISQRSEFISLASLVLRVDIVGAGEELTAFVLFVF